MSARGRGSGKGKGRANGAGQKPQRHTNAVKRKGAARRADAADDAAALFDLLRAGAANVAGVTFQINVAAHLLARGALLASPDLDVIAVTPEGFEDIDCVLQSGERVLVQTKERGVGARSIAMAELTQIIAHAAPALVSDSQARFALVTNGTLGSDLPATGWEAALADLLVVGSDLAVDLDAALKVALADASLSNLSPASLLARTHVVLVDSGLAESTLAGLAEGLKIGRPTASIVRAELLRDLATASAAQREATLATATSRTVTDLGVLAARLLQAVDVESLDEAVRAGVCEPADFISPVPLGAAEFFAGVDVGPVHIAAGMDAIRGEETSAVITGLNERRDVVIAGPSGSGKSALLWRVARMIDQGARVVRVLRVVDDEDIELLIRHVRRQLPGPGARILVAADDLGRDRMSGWSAARSRLAEIDGVLLLASVRREDLTPSMSASAVVVDPVLSETSARAVFRRIGDAGLPTVMDLDEAIERGGGLLMEFIAYVTSGQRIREVLAMQLEQLRGDPLRTDLLRLVLGAHLVGSAVPADALPAAVGRTPGEVGEALSRLAGEHLIAAERLNWKGLHDLRSETLFRLLHLNPPPTPAASFASVLPLLPPGPSGSAVRRAAVWISRDVVSHLGGGDASHRLASLEQALAPLVAAIAGLIDGLLGGDAPPEARATQIAALLEGVDRLDVVAYTHAVLPDIDRQRAPGVSVSALAGFVFAEAFGGVSFEGLLPAVGVIARSLPSWSGFGATGIVSGLESQRMALLCAQSSLPTALRLCEAAEVIGVNLDSADVSAVLHAHHAPTGRRSNDGLIEADQRAQLTASVVTMAGLRGAEVGTILGPVEDRLIAAVEVDAYGTSARLRHEDLDTEDADRVSGLARPWTFAPDSMLVADVRLFGRVDADAPAEDGYPARAGSAGGSINDQAVHLARRVSDACPEVDRVDVDVIGANLEVMDGGEKRLRSGVVPRAVTIARNVAFLAAVSEILGAESWTERLRAQAAIAAEVVDLLQALPLRLKERDTKLRLRDWALASQSLAHRIANLPTRPADRQPFMMASSPDAAIPASAAEQDEALRRPDRAYEALDLIVGVLTQTAQGLVDQNPSALAGAAMRLSSAPEKLRAARSDGAPSFAGVGETLPHELDSLTLDVARLLSAASIPEVRKEVERTRADLGAIRSAIDRVAEAASQAEGAAVARLLESSGIGVECLTAADPDPILCWHDRQAILLIDVLDADEAFPLLQNWSLHAEEETDPAVHVTVLVMDDGDVLPVALRIRGSGDALPLPEESIAAAAEAAHLPVRSQRFRRAVVDACDSLVAYSYEQFRHTQRDPSWQPAPTQSKTPPEVEDTIRNAFGDLVDAEESELSDQDVRRAAAASLALDLCAVVSDEDPTAGLAVEMASINIRALSPPATGSAAELLTFIQRVAIEADRRW